MEGIIGAVVRVNSTINAKKGPYHGSKSRVYMAGRRSMVCASSGTPLVGSESTSFPCPSCGNILGRSQRCRVQAVKYICPECRFEGP